MSALDVFVFLLLIGGAAIGFVRGFVHEVISLFAWVVAIAMLKLFHGQLWSGIEGTFHTSPAAAAVLAFAILFVPSFLIVKLLARSLGGRTRRHAMLGPVRPRARWRVRGPEGPARRDPVLPPRQPRHRHGLWSPGRPARSG